MFTRFPKCRVRAHQGQRCRSHQEKGRRGWAVGIAIRDVIHAVLLKKALLPVSSLVQGAYDIRDICPSVPSVVGRGGILKHVEIKLWPKEQMALQASARALKDTLAKVKTLNHEWTPMTRNQEFIRVNSCSFVV